ncbi:MAG: sulfatase [Saprospiraceae bacterium]
MIRPILLGLVVCLSLDAQSKDKPNIILIVVDDLGWKDVGFMGSTYYETPHLDALAAKSVVFQQAYAGAANCAPSRACLMSGQNTPRHGIYTVSPSARGNPKTRKIIPTPNTRDLAQSQLTLGEVLQQNGYATATMGKWHLGADPTTQGFDLNVAGTRRGHPKTYFSPYENPNLADGPDGEYLTDRITDEALSFIEAKKDEPFFLYLPYFTIHTPLQGKENLVDYYKNKPSKEGQGINPNYGAMVSTMDANVGRILTQLKRLNLDNTLLVFTSDNGGIVRLSSQRPLRAGKGSYYEGGIRVPLLFNWPAKNWKAGLRETPVTNLDFFPTILQLLDIPLPEGKILDGHSISEVITSNKKMKKRSLFWHFPIYLEAYSRGNDESRDPLFRTRPGSVIRSGRWKLHHYFEDDGLELYDLKKDIGERSNLAIQKQGKVQKLLKKLDTWRSATDAPVPRELNPAYVEGFVPPLRKKK